MDISHMMTPDSKLLRNQSSDHENDVDRFRDPNSSGGHEMKEIRMRTADRASGLCDDHGHTSFALELFEAHDVPLPRY